MAGLLCFGCNQELQQEPKQTDTGQWHARCDACGVTNKLHPHSDEPGKFVVAGMLVDLKRPGIP